MTRLAFLGPRGTFTEQALRSMPDAGAAELVPFAGSPAVLAAVREGRAEAGCVPIENTVEGAVAAVLDGLVEDPPLIIRREALVAVRFAVLVRPGTGAADVRTIASHNHGIAQTRGWIARELPDADVLLSTSTAEAAAQVARGEVDA
ncbi:MAG TPA: prephenate dehydratase domain-containing protein, partial [Pseudonocardia sp.]|nr:prephenate dehydratase domain-containing protein [Pseudonocardia sp.]